MTDMLGGLGFMHFPADNLPAIAALLPDFVLIARQQTRPGTIQDPRSPRTPEAPKSVLKFRLADESIDDDLVVNLLSW